MIAVLIQRRALNHGAALIKGAQSRGFRRFLVKTVLKLSVANFIHAQLCLNI